MIYKVLLLAIFSYFVGANNWDHANELLKCSQLGKKYWCISTKHAEICQATSYCKEHVWSKPMKSDNVDVCATCKETVGQIHEYLNQTDIQKGINALMVHPCYALPKTFQEMCIALVHKYGNELIKKVNNYLADSSKVCKSFHLCDSALLGPIHLPRKDGDDYCTYCQQLLGTFDMLITNKDVQDEIIAEMKSTCQYCPAKQLCTVTWDFVAPPLIKWMENYFSEPSKFCSLIHICPSSKQLYVKQHAKDILRFSSPVNVGILPVVINPKVTADICTTCEQTVGTIHLMLANKETQAQILHIMETGCQYIPGFAKALCTEMIETYGHQLITLMENYLADPSELCSLIHLCKNESPASFPMAPKQDNVDICTTCKETLGTIHMMISNKETQAQILNVMNSGCKLLPGAAKAICTELVETRGKLLITAMVNYLADPSQLCSMVHLCQNTSPVNLFVPLKEMNADICTECKETIGTVHMIISNKDTQESILIAMKAACQALPAGKELCAGLIEAYGPKLLNSLTTFLSDPDTFCKMVHLCSARNTGNSENLENPVGMMVLTSKTITPKKEVKSYITCEVCEYVMGYLDSFITDKKSEEKIKNAVENVCKYLPEYLNTQCMQYVDEYGDKVIELLVKEVNPSVVCHELNLCTASKGNSPVQHMLAMRMSLEGPSCIACEYIMGYMEKQLESKTALKEIQNVIEQVCTYIPSTIFNTECKAIVSEYGDEILKLMWKEYIKADKICKEIKLC